MHLSLSNVKAVGFDLDRTLYQDTPEINRRIVDEIVLTVIKLRPELGPFEYLREVYLKRCTEVGSSPKVLAEYGIENPKVVVNECLNNINIADLIDKDDILSGILTLLCKKYYLFLITSSPRAASLIKLRKLGIDLSLFSFVLFGDGGQNITKNDSSAFQYLLSRTRFPPEEHVYIGDNLNTDVLIPKSLGIRTICVGTYHEADFRISCIHDIRKLLL